MSSSDAQKAHILLLLILVEPEITVMQMIKASDR